MEIWNLPVKSLPVRNSKYMFSEKSMNYKKTERHFNEIGKKKHEKVRYLSEKL